MDEEIRDSIENGQYKQALTQMEEYSVDFKTLESMGIRCRDIAILADMKDKK